MHCGVNAAGVGRLAGIAEVAGGVPSGEIFFGVQAANGVTGDGGEFFLALGALFESGAEGVFFSSPQFRGGFYGTARLFRIGRITHEKALPGSQDKRLDMQTPP